MKKDSVGFKHQSVRDLAWAVCSPPLIALPSHSCVWPGSLWYQQMYLEALPWLNTLDADPAELEELLSQQKDRRLGKYFETLWLFWLTHNSHYQVLENNLQIIIDGETLGEIDLIVQGKRTGQICHWELAVKFYLGLGDTAELNNWHGPNLRDRLDIKVEHLMHRQSVISKQPRVQHWLQQAGIKVDQCAVILKGRLYYPWQSFDNLLLSSTSQASASQQLISPTICTTEHLASVWLTETKFDEIFDEKQYFIPLINKGWMESISTTNVHEFYSKSDIYKMLSNNEIRLPLQIQLQNPCRSCDRAFLVSDSWL